MKRISVFTFRDTELNIAYDNGNLAYTFEVDGKTYGYKVELKKKGIKEVSDATALLILNFFDTFDALKNDRSSK
jgi:hypothetical protein